MTITSIRLTTRIALPFLAAVALTGVAPSTSAQAQQAMTFFVSSVGSGNGAKSLGQELASSQAFANCQVQKVFQAICLRPPSNAADRSEAAQIVADFQSGGYSMKQVFAETAAYCMGN